MTFFDKLVLISIVIIIVLVQTVDSKDQEQYIEQQCELTPQWSKCNE